MNKVVLLFTFIWAQLLPSNTCAQEHLKVMDIPIDGNVSSFIEKVKSRGFDNPQFFDENNVWLTGGTFLDMPACMLLGCTPKSKTVAVVIVIVKGFETNDSIDFYKKLVLEVYKEKYGEYDETYNSNEGVNYVFQGQGGMISVFTKPLSQGAMSGISIRYSDSINCKKFFSEYSDDI
jgi:hypothetical protein